VRAGTLIPVSDFTVRASVVVVIHGRGARGPRLTNRRQTERRHHDASGLRGTQHALGRIRGDARKQRQFICFE